VFGFIVFNSLYGFCRNNAFDWDVSYRVYDNPDESAGESDKRIIGWNDHSSLA